MKVQNPVSHILPYEAFRRSNQWYTGIIKGSINIAAIVVDKLYAMPFLSGKVCAPSKISTYINGGGVGNLRLGIYEDDGTIWPGALLFDSGNIDTTLAGAKEANIAGITLYPNKLYWTAVLYSAIVTPYLYDIGFAMDCLGAPTSSNGIQTCVYEAYAFAALPATCPKTPTTAEILFPRIMLKIP
jgi:hypothetical protein